MNKRKILEHSTEYVVQDKPSGPPPPCEPCPWEDAYWAVSVKAAKKLVKECRRAKLKTSHLYPHLFRIIARTLKEELIQ
ncbi:MAG TPA: hypothetical protein ENI23_17390 [bacterium]|nr:hypothetical protein [bacterium]